MLGFRLFLHALRMILGNLSAAFRISVPLFLMAALLAWMSLTIARHPAAAAMPGGGVRVPFEALPAGFGIGFLLAIFLAVIAFLWTAVAWHRYTLLEETPGALLPPWNGGAIWSYFVAAIVWVLLVFAVGLAISIVGGFVLAMFSGSLSHGSPAVVALVFGAIVYVPIVIVSYRIAPILPAAAIGRKISVGDAWRATSGANGALFFMALVTVVVSLAASAPVAALEAVSLTLALIWQALVNWFGMLLGISILTTLYGHFVEKRDLNV